MTPPEQTAPLTEADAKKFCDATNEMFDSMPEPHRTMALEALDFRRTLSSETDRGCALMATAHLDEKLKELLRKRLVDDEKPVKALFEFNGALGTFSSRIEFAYLMGLIPKNARTDLNKLRAIRNKFAHVAGPLTFDDQSIAPLCRELYFDGVKPDAPPSSKFRRAAMGLLGVIEVATVNATHCVPSPDHDISITQEGFKQAMQLWASLGVGEYPMGDHHFDEVKDSK